MQENTCCFIGHRRVAEINALKTELKKTVEGLITEKQVDTFLFGSRSRFDDLCYSVVSDLKEKHPHIKRIYVRAEYPIINEDYEKYLLQSYEETYYPEKLVGAGRAVYVKRNFEMIDKSSFCIVFLDKESAPLKSGTRIAVNYAVKKGKTVINLFDLM